MTTKSSPITVLKAQADKMARMLKQRGKDECKAAVVMDDKTIIIEYSNIMSTSEKDLARHILDLMQEAL